MTNTNSLPLASLTSGRILAKNTLWGFGSSVGSLFVALLCVPILLKYLGTARFGVVSLVWIIEGQFGIFDAGLSSALTKLVSERLGLHRQRDIPAIFWTAILIMTVLGMLAAIVLRISASWLVSKALQVPPDIRAETITTFHLVALSLPAVISTSGLRGFLSAYQRFDLLTAARLPISLLTYLLPLFVLPFSHKLGPFVFVLVLARLLAWITHLIFCFRVSPELLHRITTAGAPLAYMFHFGSWMTVTNLVSPIMVNADRLLIGGLLSVTAVAYYATPYEAATRLWIVAGAITGVLFPAFATSFQHDRQRAALLYERGVKYIFLSLFPIVMVVLSLGKLGLVMWLGSEFANKSAAALDLLAVGVFFNSLAQIPFWAIQAAGRPDKTAKLHLLELPCYLAAFWLLTTQYGIDGAGYAWMLRAVIDSAIMFWLSTRVLPEARGVVLRLVFACAAVVPLFFIAALLEARPSGSIFTTSLLICFGIITWVAVLNKPEKEFLRNPLRFLVPSVVSRK